MSLRLPRVYPITDISLSGLSHAEQVQELASGGATFIQLREKQKSANEFYAEARAAVRVAHQLGIKLIINDRVDIAMAVGADGVHLGQDDMPVVVARGLLGPESIIGLSTHNASQALAAIKLPIDYLAIGPVFATNSKADTADVLGLSGLAEVRGIVQNLPLVAIGGINDSNASAVVETGADSIAVISCLLNDPSQIKETTQKLLNHLLST
jgi:thiamine-phosphate pyrophosphorylase